MVGTYGSISAPLLCRLPLPALRRCQCLCDSLTQSHKCLAPGASNRTFTARRVPWATGLRSFVLNPLSLVASPSRARRPAVPLALHAGPPPNGSSRPDVAGLEGVLRDEPRAVTALAPAPRGCLLAATDTLGRVLLVDGAALGVLRMWKVRVLRGAAMETLLHC